MDDFEKHEFLKEILSGSFGIALNANDLFQYACAETIVVDPLDLDWILPIFKNYKWDGLNACMAFLTNRMPIKEVQNEGFKAAYTDLVALNPKVYTEY